MQAITTGTATIDDYASQLELALAENAKLREQIAAKSPKAKAPKREFVFTPFQAAKAMNEERERLGLKSVTPQMLYSYARKGAFVISTSADGRKSVDVDSFYAWMRKHNAKNA